MYTERFSSPSTYMQTSLFLVHGFLETWYTTQMLCYGSREKITNYILVHRDFPISHTHLFCVRGSSLRATVINSFLVTVATTRTS